MLGPKSLRSVLPGSTQATERICVVVMAGLSAAVMLLAAWLIWPMALSEAANAWWGTTQILPIAASQAGATGGAAWIELVVKLTHIVAGLCLVAAWAVLVVGFLKKPAVVGTPNQ